MSPQSQLSVVCARLGAARLLLLYCAAAAAPRPDPPSFRVAVARCGEGRSSDVSPFLLNTAPPGELIDASQPTAVRICYTDSGLELVYDAAERNTFSSADDCLAPVWEKGNAMELFIAPVRDEFDVPAEYQEIDGAPSGAIWGSCITAEAVCPGYAWPSARLSFC